MKLLYDLPQADQSAFDDAVGSGEKVMYCLPFNIHQDKFVDGFLVFTNITMYKLLDGQLLASYPIIGS